MRDRIAAVDGALEIIPAPGQGSRIGAIVPDDRDHGPRVAARGNGPR
jgi:hypothetical protein